jgi:DNA polymerase I-like protein with 3'-5' exonuclease and polymerase domains
MEGHLSEERKIVFWGSVKGKDGTYCFDSRLSKLVEKTLRGFGQPPQYRYQLFDGTFYESKPDEIVLGFGGDVAKCFGAGGIAPKNRSVDSLRGLDHGRLGTGRYLVTYHPALCDSDASKEDEIAWDIRLAERLCRTGGLLPEVGTYRWVEHFEELIAAVECSYDQTGKPVEVAADTETLGLHPYDGHPIISIGATMEEGKADCVYLKDIDTEEKAKRFVASVEWLLNSPKVKTCGANFKFDLNWIKVQWGIECTNFTFDTLIAGSMVDENRSNSLENHAKIYSTMGGYDALFNAKYDKSRMDLVPKDDLLGYMGGDVDACLRVARKIKRELLDVPCMANLYINIVHPAARVFEKVEQTGLLVDRDKFEELRVEIEGKHGNGGVLADLTKRALNLLPARLKFKYRDNLSLSRPAVLRDYFFSPAGLNLTPVMRSEKTQEPSTAKPHLSMFHNVPEAQEMVKILDEMSMANKVLSTYIHGFLKHLRNDCRFHGSFMFFSGRMFADDNDDSGTTTGRLSCKDPALQTIPKHSKWAKKLRKCYPAPPGYMMWSTDCMQGELKIAACVANETNMLNAYANGLDLHAVTGAAMMGMDYSEFAALADGTEEQQAMFSLGRFKAKAANFGLLYGMMAAGFVRYAWQTFKMSLTLAQAQEIIDRFFGLYPGLIDWHTNYKNLGKRDGYVVSPFGRVRHLPLVNSRDWKIASKAERQAINAPIQSSLSELMLWAFVEISRNIPQAIPVVNIHDAGLGYVPEDIAMDVGKRIVETASNLPVKKMFGWDHQLKFTFDLEIGPNMGEMQKIKFPANDNGPTAVKVAA